MLLTIPAEYVNDCKFGVTKVQESNAERESLFTFVISLLYDVIL